MTAQEVHSPERMAYLRSIIKHRNHGKRPPNPFYTAIEKACAVGASVKIVFSTPREADRLVRRISSSKHQRQVRGRLRGNTVTFIKRPE